MIAALYVETDGCYYGLEGVDPWGARGLGGGRVELDGRDARDYAGPHPVVAHPPCKRYGRFADGGPASKVRLIPGADGGTFKAAIGAVRRFGGVLEHPAHSKAWPWFGIAKPPAGGGWVVADLFGGYTCCVEQGHYGHFARKQTWLYALGVDLPDLVWASVGKTPEEMGYRPGSRGGSNGSLSSSPLSWVPKRRRLETPIEFRDLLLSMARSVRPVGVL